MGAFSDIAKVFMSGRSQAVRLPKDFRFDVAQVSVRRIGKSLILTPLNEERAAQVQAVFDAWATQGVILERAKEWPQSERETLLP